MAVTIILAGKKYSADADGYIDSMANPNEDWVGFNLYLPESEIAEIAKRMGCEYSIDKDKDTCSHDWYSADAQDKGEDGGIKYLVVGYGMCLSEWWEDTWTTDGFLGVVKFGSDKGGWENPWHWQSYRPTENARFD